MRVEVNSIWIEKKVTYARDKPNVVITKFEPVIVADVKTDLVVYQYLNGMGSKAFLHKEWHTEFLALFRPADPHEIVKLRKSGALDKFRQPAILNV